MTKQSGNMLFILLVAIALLGALTAILVRSDSSSDDTGSSEQLSIQASNILKFASSIETGVQTLLSRGCGENDINLYVSGSNLPVNPLAPADKSCDVFHAKGAGVPYKKLPANILTQSGNYYQSWHSDQAHCIFGVGQGNTATCSLAQQDLRITIVSITSALCAEINRQLGVTTTGQAIPEDSDGFDEWYTGRFYDPGNTLANKIIGNAGNAPAANLQFKKAACFKDTDGTATGWYSFYAVIIAR